MCLSTISKSQKTMLRCKLGPTGICSCSNEVPDVVGDEEGRHLQRVLWKLLCLVRLKDYQQIINRQQGWHFKYLNTSITWSSFSEKSKTLTSSLRGFTTNPFTWPAFALESRVNLKEVWLSWTSLWLKWFLRVDCSAKKKNNWVINSEILRLPRHSVEQLLGVHKPGIVCC